jgi:4-amino-4-deoxy-L-arabinose transferase-like glycosyltransferase
VKLASISSGTDSRNPTELFVVLGFCAFLFFYGLSVFGLVGADEPRYAQVAREMFERRDWITPTLGGVPWLEKPVLYYWETILAYNFAGVSDWAARLPSAFSATCMVLAIYFFLRRFRPGSQLDGALITASCAAVIGFSRAAATDMPLAANLVIALLCWYAFFESRERRWLAFSYLFLGLAMLAKGPVAVLLAVLILAAFAIARKDFEVIAETVWLPGVVVFLLVASPWYLLVQWHNPEFFRVFFLEHNFARFSTNLYRHRQPFWYYLPVVVLGLAPWVVVALLAVSDAIRGWWREGRAVLYGEDAFDVFLVLWLILPPLFFSISQSKLPGYVLPAIPACAILVATNIRRRVSMEQSISTWLMVAHSVIAAAIPVLIVRQLFSMQGVPASRTVLVVLLAVGVTLALAIIFTLRSRLGLRMLRFVTLVPVLLAVGAILKMGGPVIDGSQSVRPLTTVLGAMETQRLPIAVFGVPRQVEYGLGFYRNQVVSRYERGEVPETEHLLIAPSVPAKNVRDFVGERRVSHLASFERQHLECYWVEGLGANRTPTEQHMH